MTRTQTPPEVLSFSKVNIFHKPDFNSVLWENGYDVILEEALACPCKGSSSDNKSTCSNCLGTGWVFINPIATRAFITSINKSTKYKDWSPEFIGTVAITLMDTDKVGFMDKITLSKRTSVMSESLIAHSNTDNYYPLFVFTTYKVVSIRHIFIFNDDGLPLIKLPVSDYAINATNSYAIDIKEDNLPLNFNGRIGITYTHRITYNVLDIPHDLRMSKEYDVNGKRESVEMPIQAIARKAQYELGVATNYAGTNISVNSYLF